MSEDPNIENNPPTILVVDEDETMISALKLQLEDRDWMVYSAHTSQEAITLNKESGVEVALIGIGAASFDGLQLAQNLRSSNPGVLIIALTGYPTVDQAIEILKTEATDYLVKPFRIEQLLVAIERAHREQNLIRENESLKRDLAALREDIVGTLQTADASEADAEIGGEEIPLRSTDYGGLSTQSKGPDPDAIASYERQMAPSSPSASDEEEGQPGPDSIEKNKETNSSDEQSD
jgi:DNA-binding response OmpR family regulator